MLAIPKVGMAKSVAPEHNVQLDALCDWIEASLLFDDLDFISASEIIDVLHEEELYSDSRFYVGKLIDRAWVELPATSRVHGG